MPTLAISLSDDELKDLNEHLLMSRDNVSQSTYFRWLMKKDMKGEIVMKNTVDDFMVTKTRRYDCGYRVYLSDAPEFATEAVVEDADGKRVLVDLSDRNWDDGESMADLAAEVYERK